MPAGEGFQGTLQQSTPIEDQLEACTDNFQLGIGRQGQAGLS
jgi:hypothetical protein